MIRQAISCDICGAEKKQTNHWFIAYAHAGELRVSGWSTGIRLRAGTKHLCGQTCLHKLLDEFIAGTMSNRPQAAPELPDHDERAATDASLTSGAAYTALAAPIAASRAFQVVPAAVLAIAPPRAIDAPPAPPFDEPLTYLSRRRRAEAWERERERCASLATHRKTS